MKNDLSTLKPGATTTLDDIVRSGCHCRSAGGNNYQVVGLVVLQVNAARNICPPRIYIL